MVRARLFVFDEDEKHGEAQRRTDYSTDNLKRADGKPFCVECRTVFWGVSRQKLFPQGDKCPMPRDSKKDVSVMAWMNAQLFCLDVDPEDGCWTMPAARKKRVYDWYTEDVVKWPCCYCECTKRWFNQVWEDHFPFVRCRKWLRFAKCVDCVRWRTLIADRTQPKKQRLDAARELRAHYKAMKRERAYHKE